MGYANISAEISDADLQSIKDALAAIRTKLPFLITLTKAERKSQRRSGPKSRGFLENCLTAAQNNPNVIPADVSVVEMTKDVRLWTALDEVSSAIAQLASDVQDTRMALGTEAQNGASQVYALIKAASQRSPGLKPVYEELRKRYARNGQKTPATPAKV